MSTTIEAKLVALDLVLPARAEPPHGVKFAFSPVRLHGDRAYISGHGPLALDGKLAEPLGRLGIELTVEQGYYAARLAALAMLASLQRTLGELDRVRSWLRVFAMIHAAPGFTQHPAVSDGFSDLILALYGPDRGAHSRSSVGIASLPFGMPIEIEAEIAIV
jgi:enamine deaminase RidA (YjgF/YER057c/UK114 family)